MTTDSVTPMFTHDCEQCVFLGHYNNHDLYYCGHPDVQQGIPTLIARWGNDGPEYSSGMAFVGTIPEITEAYRRAKKLGCQLSGIVKSV